MVSESRAGSTPTIIPQPIGRFNAASNECAPATTSTLALPAGTRSQLCRRDRDVQPKECLRGNRITHQKKPESPVWNVLDGLVLYGRPSGSYPLGRLGGMSDFCFWGPETGFGKRRPITPESASIRRCGDRQVAQSHPLLISGRRGWLLPDPDVNTNRLQPPALHYWRLRRRPNPSFPTVTVGP